MVAGVNEATFGPCVVADLAVVEYHNDTADQLYGELVKHEDRGLGVLKVHGFRVARACSPWRLRARYEVEGSGHDRFCASTTRERVKDKSCSFGAPPPFIFSSR